MAKNVLKMAICLNIQINTSMSDKLYTNNTYFQFKDLYYKKEIKIIKYKPKNTMLLILVVYNLIVFLRKKFR